MANSGIDTIASRVIHDVWGWKNTLRARHGRPISSHTHSRPAPTKARPIRASGHTSPSLKPASEATSRKPVPVPPPTKLPAARMSQFF